MEKQTTIEKLKEYDEAYFNDGVSLISDDDYDILRKKARRNFGTDRYFNTIGSDIKYGSKVKHDFPMKSCQKCNLVEEFNKWTKKVKTEINHNEYIILPKYDGLSYTAKYDKGKLYQLSTRGNGIEGQDITSKVKFIQDIPLEINIQDKIEIRGELILPKNYKNTNTVTDHQTPLRNIAVGIINRKEISKEIENIHAIAYKLIGLNFLNEKLMLDIIKNLGFKTSSYNICNSIDSVIQCYTNWNESLKSRFLYEIDGIVVSLFHFEDQQKNLGNNEHHFDYQIAWKFSNESKSTHLLDIEWNVSRHGNLIPIAIFTPVVINSAKLQKASLSSYKTVIQLQLEKGDEIRIVKANDVIPYIEENITKRIKQRGKTKKNNIKENNLLVPIVCPSCNSNLIIEGVHLKCLNKICPERTIQKIVYWVEQCGMENISEKTIRLLYELELVRSINDLYKLKAETLKNVKGFGDKKILNLIQEIDKSRIMNTMQFINKLGIHLVGEKAVKKLDIKTIKDFWDFNDETYIIGQNLISFKKENKDYVQELLRIITIKDEEEENINMNTKGIVVMTGKGHDTRANLQEKAIQMGYSIGKSVTKETNILVCEDIISGSTKLKKAEKLDIKVMSYPEFFSIS